MSRSVRDSYLYLHISVFLWGFTAILGALISFAAVPLVWWRVLITAVIMLLFPGVLSEIRRLSPKILIIYFGIGILVALHWICFYGSIKLANASVALICMSTTSLFTAFLEPWINRQSLNPVDIIFGILIIPSMIFTVQGMQWSMMSGFWVGMAAAALAALFAVYNKMHIDRSTPYTITAIEMTASWIFITMIIPILLQLDNDLSFIPHGRDVILLLVLSILCTVVPFILHLKAFEHLSAFSSNLVINLEPVYGILLAILILNEHQDLNIKFYIGVVIILIIVTLYPFVKKRF